MFDKKCILCGHEELDHGTYKCFHENLNAQWNDIEYCWCEGFEY